VADTVTELREEWYLRKAKHLADDIGITECPFIITDGSPGRGAVIPYFHSTFMIIGVWVQTYLDILRCKFRGIPEVILRLWVGVPIASLC